MRFGHLTWIEDEKSGVVGVVGKIGQAAKAERREKYDGVLLEEVVKRWSKQIYIALRRKICASAAAAKATQRRPRVYKGERFVCKCGEETAKFSKSRHYRKPCSNGKPPAA